MNSIHHSNINHLANSLRETGRFFYNNSHKLVLISIGWFFISLPVVTIGPATLAAYVAIDQLDSDANRIDSQEIIKSVQKQFIPSFLLGLVPLVFFSLSILYFSAQAHESTLARVLLFYTTLYLALYSSLVMIPTFRKLAIGKSPSEATVAGIRWTAAHPTLAMLTGLFTAVVLVITLMLTIGFILLFPAIAFSFHMKIVPKESNNQ